MLVLAGDGKHFGVGATITWLGTDGPRVGKVTKIAVTTVLRFECEGETSYNIRVRPYVADDEPRQRAVFLHNPERISVAGPGA